MIKDFDYYQGDMPNQPISQISPDHCCHACRVTPNCVAWTMNPATQQCWLKNRLLPLASAPGLVTGTINSGSGCSSVQDVDYPGNDIYLPGLGEPDTNACCQSCLVTPGCILWTQSGGNCYVKNKIGTIYPATGKISGLIYSNCSTSFVNPKTNVYCPGLTLVSSATTSTACQTQCCNNAATFPLGSFALLVQLVWGLMALLLTVVTLVLPHIVSRVRDGLEAPDQLLRFKRYIMQVFLWMLLRDFILGLPFLPTLDVHMDLKVRL